MFVLLFLFFVYFCFLFFFSPEICTFSLIDGFQRLHTARAPSQSTPSGKGEALSVKVRLSIGQDVSLELSSKGLKKKSLRDENE